MLRRFLVLMSVLLICYTLWWIGPLIAIGTFFPLASSEVRLGIIAILSGYALWPFIASVHHTLRHLRVPWPTTGKKTRPRDRVTTSFFDALRTLQQLSLARQKTRWQRWRQRWTKSYLCEKPWFLMMGPPGCGKTSVIYQSGERFLLTEPYAPHPTTDIGATRDCHWWLTERAVYIDTAGEWTDEQEQRAGTDHARQKLFSLIRQHRRFPGIDGIILCLDAAGLLSASFTARKTLADRLRVRMMETASFFRCDLAVYLLLTHLDQLPGGESFLTLMRDDQLSEGLGIALSVTPGEENDFSSAETHFTALQARISHYILDVLHDAPESTLRYQLLLFSESLGNLQKCLFTFLPQLFPPLTAGYAGRLRQLWLGSSAALKPREALFQRDAELCYATRPAGGIYATALTRAIEERGVLSSSGPQPLRHRLLTAGRYMSVILTLGLLLWFMAARYLQEADAVARAEALFAEAKRLTHEIPLTMQVNDDLIAASEQLGYITAPFPDRSSRLPSPYFEQYLLNKAVKQTWQRHLYNVFWPAVERFVAHELHKNILSFSADVYNTLKIYRMLALPARRDSAVLESWFMQRWNDFAPAGYTDRDRQLFRYYLRELFSDRSSRAPVTTLNADLVHRAQLNAMKIAPWLRVIQHIRELPLAPHISNVTLADAAGQGVALMLSRKSQNRITDVAISGFYTRSGYRDHFLPHLQQVAAAVMREEQWVLNNIQDGLSEADLMTAAQKLADEAQKQYLIQYADEWEGFINDIRLRPVTGLDDAALLARQLAEPSSPLANLVRYAATELTLNEESLTHVSGWLAQQSSRLSRARRNVLDDLNGKPVRHRITPEQGITERFTALRRLGYALDPASATNSDPLSRAFEQVYNSLVTLTLALRAGQILPQKGEFSRLEIEMASQPEPVRSVILDLIAIGQRQSLQKSKENLSRDMASLDFNLCTKAIGGRYPFKRAAREEVGIADFQRLFAPDGSLHRFFERYLAPYVDSRGGHWQVKPGSQEVIGQQTLAAFENAALIRNTFFDASGKMALSMIIHPLSLSSTIAEAVLNIDGQQIVYSHGDTQPVHINWPGPKGGVYVTLTLKTQDGRAETTRFEGPWAIFRFYDASNPVVLSGNRRELTMAISNIAGFFRAELSSTMKDYPLWSRALNHFSCPQSF